MLVNLQVERKVPLEQLPDVMKAITDVYSVPDAVLKALQAGADIALWVTTDEVPAVLERLKAAVPSELPEQRVNDSLRRVAAMKGHSPQC